MHIFSAWGRAWQVAEPTGGFAKRLRLSPDLPKRPDEAGRGVRSSCNVPGATACPSGPRGLGPVPPTGWSPLASALPSVSGSVVGSVIIVPLTITVQWLRRGEDGVERERFGRFPPNRSLGGSILQSHPWWFQGPWGGNVPFAWEVACAARTKVGSSGAQRVGRALLRGGAGDGDQLCCDFASHPNPPDERRGEQKSSGSFRVLAEPVCVSSRSLASADKRPGPLGTTPGHVALGSGADGLCLAPLKPGSTRPGFFSVLRWDAKAFSKFS